MKTDDLIVEGRIEVIVELLISGMTSYAVIKYVLNPKNNLNWNIKQRQIEIYISKAKEKIRNSATNLDIDLELGKTIKRFELILKKAIANKDYKLAATVTEKLANLLNLQRKNDVPIPSNDTGEIVIK